MYLKPAPKMVHLFTWCVRAMCVYVVCAVLYAVCFVCGVVLSCCCCCRCGVVVLCLFASSSGGTNAHVMLGNVKQHHKHHKQHAATQATKSGYLTSPTSNLQPPTSRPHTRYLIINRPCWPDASFVAGGPSRTLARLCPSPSPPIARQLYRSQHTHTHKQQQSPHTHTHTPKHTSTHTHTTA